MRAHERRENTRARGEERRAGKGSGEKERESAGSVETLRCACCRNETVERVAGTMGGCGGYEGVARRRGMGNCNEQPDSYK